MGSQQSIQPPPAPEISIIRYRNYSETLQAQRAHRREQLSARNYNKDFNGIVKQKPKRTRRATRSTSRAQFRKEIDDMERYQLFSSRFQSVDLIKGFAGVK